LKDNMTANKWFSLYVAGSVMIMWVLYSMVHDVKAEQVLLEYQVGKIQQTLNTHTEKLELLVASSYELHTKVDTIMKGSK
tara:strand:+ start:229 stop:468 length:240 start_codon:yes stop_codon:yes gene_type:complete